MVCSDVCWYFVTLVVVSIGKDCRMLSFITFVSVDKGGENKALCRWLVSVLKVEVEILIVA